MKALEPESYLSVLKSHNFLIFEVGSETKRENVDQQNDLEVGDVVEFENKTGNWEPGTIKFISDQHYVIETL